MTKFIGVVGIGDRVKELGSVSNEDLCALYSRAEGLLFPSLEEGFGWPVLEAQASGCPVFTSNRAPMTEVGGDAAVYIDPNNPVTAAEVINQHLDDLQGMRERGLVNAQKFSNLKMRDAYIEIYEQLVKSH
jgi:glycosyltransferase involved in cell wall biosynthesis